MGRQTTPQPRLFDTVSQAERHIKRLRAHNIGPRTYAIHRHPKRPHAWTIAILAGDLLIGHVLESATRHEEVE